MSYKLPSHLVSKRLRVALIGVGGTGSYLAQELIRLSTALNALDPNSDLDVVVFDDGIVSESNLARQHYFPTQQGLNKAEATVWIANNLWSKSWKAESGKRKARNLKHT